MFEKCLCMHGHTNEAIYALLHVTEIMMRVYFWTEWIRQLGQQEFPFDAKRSVIWHSKKKK